MASYEDSKDGLGAVAPDGVIESGWQDAEPLITPKRLRSLHLWGVPLVSAIKNPFTGKPDILTDDELKEFIVEAANLAETEIGGGYFNIFARQYDERFAYDQKAQESFGYNVLRRRPPSSIESLAIQSSDGVNIWTVPLAWIDTGYLHQGQINILPFAVAAQSGTTVPVTGPVGMGLLPSLFRFNWVPGMWTVRYTAGFKDNSIPKIVNSLIGVVAAMEVLSMLATTYARSSSSSLGIDGLSQSISTPGADLFKPRLEELAQKRGWLIKKIQRQYGLGMWADNV